MKPIKRIFDSDKGTNDKNQKFKIDDNVRMSKNRNVLAKGHTLN